MDSKEQHTKIANGQKMTDAYSGEGRDIIYLKEVNGIRHGDLKILSDDVKNVLPETEYVLLYIKNEPLRFIEYHAPIRVRILYEIHKLEDSLYSLKQEKEFLKKTGKGLAKLLKKAIIYMKKVEGFYNRNDEEDELSEAFKVIDGFKEEREIARQSYETILEHTNKTLNSLKSQINTDKRKNSLLLHQTIS